MMEPEQKYCNFQRLSKARLYKIKHFIYLLQNLSNTSFYAFTKKDIDKIFDDIEKSLKTAKKAFKGKYLKD